VYYSFRHKVIEDYFLQGDSKLIFPRKNLVKLKNMFRHKAVRGLQSSNFWYDTTLKLSFWQVFGCQTIKMRRVERLLSFHFLPRQAIRNAVQRQYFRVPNQAGPT
jgi:hypothetical protein